MAITDARLTQNDNSFESKNMMTKRTLITGITGQDGANLAKFLLAQCFENILGTIYHTATDFDPKAEGSVSLYLRKQQAVSAFFDRERPNHVFLAAAEVGCGLANNSYRTLRHRQDRWDQDVRVVQPAVRHKICGCDAYQALWVRG
jgi:hypothetical protein